MNIIIYQYLYIRAILLRTNYFTDSGIYLGCRHLGNSLEGRWVPGHTWVGASSQHPARVVGGLGGNKVDGSVYGILGFQDGHRAVDILREKGKYWRKWEPPFPKPCRQSKQWHLCRPRSYLWHVGKPLQNGVDSFKVVTDCVVCHPVVVHDLDPSQLVVGGVNFPSKHLGKEKWESYQCWDVSMRCWLRSYTQTHPCSTSGSLGNEKDEVNLSQHSFPSPVCSKELLNSDPQWTEGRDG